MKIGVLAFIVIMFAGTAYAAKEYVVPTTWRYKITIEIETPEGIKSGSAVREVRAWKNAAKIINPDVAPIEYEVIGEAVVVDLGERGVLFGLMNNFAYLESGNAFWTENSNSLDSYKSLRIGDRSELKKDLPAFVTFSDLNDPKSVVGCGPAVIESVLGKGVRLRSIMIEITDNPVTQDIEKILPWLPKYKGARGFLGGEEFPPFNDPSQTYIKYSNFVKGKYSHLR